jgi:hypothetical protein
MPNRSTHADSTPAVATMAQFRGTAKNTSPAILFLGALLAILTATALEPNYVRHHQRERQCQHGAVLNFRRQQSRA